MIGNSAKAQAGAQFKGAIGNAGAKKYFHFAELFSGVKRDFYQNLPTLLIFDIFFKIIATAIFGPASAWIFNRLVASSGAWVIGNEQIISFLISPVGMTAAIISGALALAITFAEQAGIILIVSRFNAGRKITAYQALLQTLKYLRVLIGLGLQQIIIGALYLAPLAAIAATTFYLLSSQQDLNYLLVEKPPAYWIGTAITAVLGLCALLVIALLYIRWIFSVPFCVLEGQKSAGAIRNSRDLVRGNFWRVSAVVLGWALLVIGVGVLSTFLLEILGELLLNRVGENLTFIVIAVCILFGLFGLIAAALTFIGFTTSCLVTVRLHYDIGNKFRVETDFLSLASRLVNADVIGAARKRKMEVHVWTINRSDGMSYFINLGVDNIITDYPAKLVALINERAALNDVEKFLLVAADMLKR